MINQARFQAFQIIVFMHFGKLQRDFEPVPSVRDGGWYCLQAKGRVFGISSHMKAAM